MSKEMKTLTMGGNTYEIVDEKARKRIDNLVLGGEGGSSNYYVTPEQYGAKGDGVTDDTDAIQQALNSGNLAISLSQKKTYKITSPLSIPENVALYGNDATLLKEGSPIETSILHIYSSNATIKDLNLVTTLNSISADLNPPERADEEIWSNCSGISVYSATNITIDNVHMTDMQFGIKCIESSNIDISNCNINGECLYCTYLQDTTDVKYTNNSFCCTQYGSIHHHDVYIEGGCWNIYFDGCAFTGLSGVSIKCGDADPTIRNTYDIFVQNCTFDVPCPIYHGAGNSACKFTDSIIKTTGKYVFNVAGNSEIEASNFHVEASSDCSLVTANLPGTYSLSNGYAKIGKVAVISAPDGNVYVDINNCTLDCYRNDELSNIIYINRTSFGGSLSFVDNKVNLYNFGKWENSINIPNETTDVYVFGNVFRVKSEGELNHIVNNTGSESAQFINNISPDTNVFNYEGENAKGIFIGNIVGGEPIKLSEFDNDSGYITGDEEKLAKYISDITFNVEEVIIDEDIVTLGTGWSGNNTDGYTHASGNTEPLSFAINAIDGEKYIIEYDCSASGDAILLKLGNAESIENVYPTSPYNGGTTNQWGLVCSGDNGILQVMPISTYDGYIKNLKCYRISEDGTKEKTVNLYNVGLGNLPNHIAGFYNFYLSPTSMQKSVNGTRNVAIGYASLRDIVSGGRNIGLGTFSLASLIYGENNIGIGADAGLNLTLAENLVAIGKGAAAFGAKRTDDIAIGRYALTGKAGAETLNNIGIGVEAGRDCTGKANIFIGASAGAKATSGGTNVVIGNSAGTAITTGWGNTFIGANANAGGNYSQTVVIGNGAKATKHRQAVLGGDATVETVLKGDIVVRGTDGKYRQIVFNEDGSCSWTEISTT